MNAPLDPKDQPSCSGCIHLQVTYNREQPHGCLAFGFRSRALPWRVVFEQSGTACQLKQLRIPPQKGMISRARH